MRHTVLYGCDWIGIKQKIKCFGNLGKKSRHWGKHVVAFKVVYHEEGKQTMKLTIRNEQIVMLARKQRSDW